MATHIIDLSAYRDSIDADRWREVQAQFFLDCFEYVQGRPAASPEEVGDWLKQQTRPLRASLEDDFFRGWLVRYALEQSGGGA
jgi:hypothetical protein